MVKSSTNNSAALANKTGASAEIMRTSSSLFMILFMRAMGKSVMVLKSAARGGIFQNNRMTRKGRIAARKKLLAKCHSKPAPYRLLTLLRRDVEVQNPLCFMLPKGGQSTGHIHRHRRIIATHELHIQLIKLQIIPHV
jgi:hypothetical protein